MPSAPLRYCPVPRCPNKVAHGRCAMHQAGSTRDWQGERHRIRGRKLQQLRMALFANEPLCRQCSKAGKRVVATIRDHIIPLFEGGTDEPSNIQPLCLECSDAKSQREAARGRRANGTGG